VIIVAEAAAGRINIGQGTSERHGVGSSILPLATSLFLLHLALF